MKKLSPTTPPGHIRTGQVPQRGLRSSSERPAPSERHREVASHRHDRFRPRRPHDVGQKAWRLRVKGRDEMKTLGDPGLVELRRLEAEAKSRCAVCTNGSPPRGHHHHFCLVCGCVVVAGEEQTHRQGHDAPRASSKRRPHRIQFCPRCVPPTTLDPTSSTARNAIVLGELFGAMLDSALEAERLLALPLEWRGTTRLVPRDLRPALYPLGLAMLSTILEDLGPRVLGHPYVWTAFRSLLRMADAPDWLGDAARHEIRTIAALLVGDRKPLRRLGREFDLRLLEEFERLRNSGGSTADAFLDLANQTGLTLVSIEKRISRARERAGKKTVDYVERKGPARGKRRP